MKALFALFLSCLVCEAASQKWLPFFYKTVYSDVGYRSSPSTTNVIDDFDALGTWTQYYGTASLNTDSAYLKTGTGSIKIVSDTTHTYSYYYKAVDINLQNYPYLGLWIYCPDASDVDYCYVMLYTDTVAPQSYFRFRFIPHTGWTLVNLCQNSYEYKTGTPQWSQSVKRFFIEFANHSTAAFTAYFDTFYGESVTTGRFVSLDFDNPGTNMILTIYPMLAARGFVGRVNPTWSAIDTGNNMTSANVTTMFAAGWDIGSHPASSLNGTSNDCYTLLQTSQNWLISKEWTNGVSENTFVWSNGATAQTGWDAATTLGMLNGRTTTLSCPILAWDGNPLYMGSYEFTQTRGMAHCLDMLERFQASTGGYLPFLFHQVWNTVGDLYATPTEFGTFLDRLKELSDAGTVRVVTPSWWIRNKTVKAWRTL